MVRSGNRINRIAEATERFAEKALDDVALETCLSQGDLLRLTESMIDEQDGVIRLAGGRKKTSVEQLSPLTIKAQAILLEIRTAKRTGAIVPNVNGMIFTRDDG